MKVRGVGVDVVDVERFAASLKHNPRLVHAIFTEVERKLPPRSLAARFAAKEAVAKALGSPGRMRWHDCEVRKRDSGEPYLSIVGSVKAAAESRGISSWHLSLSHDGGVAIAMVVAEG